MVENHFVKIKGIEIAEIVEFPLETDYTLSLEVLRSQFSRATELKYLNRETDKVKIVPKRDSKFYFSSNLRSEDLLFFSYGLDSIKNVEKPQLLTKKPEETITSLYSRFPKTFDLLLLGLSYDTTEENLNSYVSRFGELMYCKLKLDYVTKESKGMGYIRFKDEYHQNRCLNATHLIDKTKILIQIPKEKLTGKSEQDYKIYVYNISPSITREELRVYFSQFGMIADITKLPEKRNFAFITFCESASLSRVFARGLSHTFNGGRVNVNRIMKRAEYQNSSKTVNNGDQSKSNGLKRSSSDVSEPREKQVKGDKPVAMPPDFAMTLKPVDHAQQNYQMLQPFLNNQFTTPPCNYQYTQVNTPANVMNPYYHSSSSNVSTSASDFSNQNTPLQYFGNQSTSSSAQILQGNGTLTIPIAFPPPVFYQSNQVTEIRPLTTSQGVDNSGHNQSQMLPIQSPEERNQIQSLVNQFIQEIKNNLSKLTHV